jgi:hypothetical protein
MIATTISNSIRENPLFLFRIPGSSMVTVTDGRSGSLSRERLNWFNLPTE